MHRIIAGDYSWMSFRIDRASQFPRYHHVSRKDHSSVQRINLRSYTLLLLHALYLIYSEARQLLSRLYGILSGLILTSSSRELIKSDISTLTKLPSHLAVIMTQGDLDTLIDGVANLAAWSICSSIPILTIFEERGELKGMDSSLQVAIKRKLRRYFRDTKKIAISTPAWGSTGTNFMDDDVTIPDLEINILCRDDGRESLLELTRSLCKLAARNCSTTNSTEPQRNAQIQHSIQKYHSEPALAKTHVATNTNYATKHKFLQGHSEPAVEVISETSNVLSSRDVTISFMDAHLAESTISEPNLLLVFSPKTSLNGFPPWSLRLCEICYVQGSQGVTYRGFLKGLRRYARAEMRFGH